MAWLIPIAVGCFGVSVLQILHDREMSAARRVPARCNNESVRNIAGAFTLARAGRLDASSNRHMKNKGSLEWACFPLTSRP